MASPLRLCPSSTAARVDAKLVRQDAPGAQEFVTDLVDHPFAPFGKHPDTLVGCQIRRWSRSHFGKEERPEFTGIHTHAAQRALIRDFDGRLADGDGGEGTNIDTNPAYRALLAIDKHFHSPGTLASLR